MTGRDLLLATLTTPPGEPGSARARYGAAMALYQQGAIGPDLLEVFRILSPLDGEDPASLLQNRGLTLPTPAPGPATRIAALILAADRYLTTLPGPGVAEVRAGLATAEPVLPGGNPNTVVQDWLAIALDLAAPDQPALAAAIAAAAPDLAWTTYAYPDDSIGPDFPGNHAFVAIARGADFELGLFLIAPRTLYRDHAHAAPELYAPLTGPTLFRFGPGTPLYTYHAHQPVWNDPHAPHLIKSGPAPFLCLYGWTRDVNAPAYVIPAEDWDSIAATDP